MKTKLVIFDLDGTLLNTIEDLGRACNHALEKCGFPLREISEYNDFVGRGICNMFRNAMPEDSRTEENVMKMKEFFLPYYNEHKSDFTKPYDGIPELLEDLERHGIAFALASNKYQEGAESLIRTYFRQHRFVKILGQREGAPIKPDPEIITEITAAYGAPLSSDEIVYVGDSDVDMQTGINAGVVTIGVEWGFRTREELEAYHPYRICSTAEELGRTILARK